ncbi:hypothetical protein [Vulgatibacter sp.]|uniref:hypothetical protein n=1 Tax=Vulgatibacter sp. TaxID=1971226 RepID=UPI003563108B
MARWLLLALGAPAWLSACGLDCDEYCDKMAQCGGGDCDRGRCEDLCEETLDAGWDQGWEDQAQCALDVSCRDLEDDACLPTARLGIQWCSIE